MALDLNPRRCPGIARPHHDPLDERPRCLQHLGTLARVQPLLKAGHPRPVDRAQVAVQPGPQRGRGRKHGLQLRPPAIQLVQAGLQAWGA